MTLSFGHIPMLDLASKFIGWPSKDLPELPQEYVYREEHQCQPVDHALSVPTRAWCIRFMSIYHLELKYPGGGK